VLKVFQSEISSSTQKKNNWKSPHSSFECQLVFIKQIETKTRKIKTVRARVEKNPVVPRMVSDEQREENKHISSWCDGDFKLKKKKCVYASVCEDDDVFLFILFRKREFLGDCRKEFKGHAGNSYTIRVFFLFVPLLPISIDDRFHSRSNDGCCAGKGIFEAAEICGKVIGTRI
jgi:hypothetical protein